MKAEKIRETSPFSMGLTLFFFNKTGTRLVVHPAVVGFILILLLLMLFAVCYINCSFVISNEVMCEHLYIY